VRLLEAARLVQTASRAKMTVRPLGIQVIVGAIALLALQVQTAKQTSTNAILILAKTELRAWMV